MDIQTRIARERAEAAIGRLRQSGSAGQRVAGRKDSGGEAPDEAMVNSGVAPFPAVPAATVGRESIERTGSGFRPDEDRQRRDRASVAADFDSQQLRDGLSAPRRVSDLDRQAKIDQAIVRRVGEDAGRQRAGAENLL